MAEERAQRRLAAILAADVVGYSRLMERDEAGTLAALKARRREVLEAAGRRASGPHLQDSPATACWSSSPAPSTPCNAPSTCSRAWRAANAIIAEDRRIVLRIGVNLGDVMVEGSDLYGDGVNIAARLEASPSRAASASPALLYDQSGTSSRSPFEDLGEQTLKNIAEPVRVYRVSTAQPARHRQRRPTLPLPTSLRSRCCRSPI